MHAKHLMPEPKSDPLNSELLPKTVSRIDFTAVTERSCTSGAWSLRALIGRVAAAQARGDGVVELDGDDKGDAPVRAENAEGGAEGVERLTENDAAFDGAGDFRW